MREPFTEPRTQRGILGGPCWAERARPRPRAMAARAMKAGVLERTVVVRQRTGSCTGSRKEHEVTFVALPAATGLEQLAGDDVSTGGISGDRHSSARTRTCAQRGLALTSALPRSQRSGARPVSGRVPRRDRRGDRWLHRSGRLAAALSAPRSGGVRTISCSEHLSCRARLRLWVMRAGLRAHAQEEGRRRRSFGGRETDLDDQSCPHSGACDAATGRSGAATTGDPCGANTASDSQTVGATEEAAAAPQANDAAAAAAAASGEHAEHAEHARSAKPRDRPPRPRGVGGGGGLGSGGGGAKGGLMASAAESSPLSVGRRGKGGAATPGSSRKRSSR